MRRGEVVWAELGHPIGSEASGRRPAVVVSNDGANEIADVVGRGVVTIVPVTSNVERVGPFQVLLPASSCGLSAPSKAQCEQVRAIDVSRIGSVIGRLTPSLEEEVDDALRFQLRL